MTVRKEASHLWLFESHNNSKRSQWLQSTLSELEEKTKEMLKLIECHDADTFAQRAEMYYKRRLELVNMIEDFYRAYRSLAEQHNQLKMELGNPFSNRSSLHKQWIFTDNRSPASSVTFDSESEVDDPSEEDQVESKFTELPRDKNDNDLVNLKCVDAEILIGGINKERSDRVTYSIDSELPRVSYPGSEEIHIETTRKQLPHNYKKGDSDYDEKQMVEAVESSKVMTRNTGEDMSFQHSEPLYGESEEGQDKNTLTEIQEKRDTKMSNQLIEEAESKMENVSEELSESSFVDLNMMEEVQGKKCNDSDVMKVMSEEVERPKGESVSFRAELERKDEEKREVIRQLSVSIDILKEENDTMRKFIKNSKTQKFHRAFEFRKLKALFSGKLFGGSPSHTNIPTTLAAPRELQVF